LTSKGGWLGLSPHSPYATHPALLTQAAQIAKAKDWLLTTHLAESLEEFHMFCHARGRLYDWLHDQRDMRDCGSGSPVQQLDRCGYLSSRLLAVHVNCLAQDDDTLLGKRGVSVVHCPRSHAYFRHQPFLVAALRNAGVNICLGTDSLATTKRSGRGKLELNLFAEMRVFAESHPDLRPQTILEMVTTNAARALGRSADLGALFRGARADLIALPLTGKIEDVFEEIVHCRGKVDGSMIDGRWVIELP
jgi:cytosine/adenosine deaminase-related metal-dependent hydrolase